MISPAQATFEHEVGELLVAVAIGDEQLEGLSDQWSSDRVDVDAA
ncbi:hypothetical protein [Gordonia terrae]|nr:hypothetical protein [Gordonia terrae]